MITATFDNDTSGASGLSFADNQLLPELLGPLSCNLTQIESALGVAINVIGNQLTITGDPDSTHTAMQSLRAMYQRLELGKPLGSSDIDAILRFGEDPHTAHTQAEMFKLDMPEIRTRKKTIEPRSPKQRYYIKLLSKRELVFGLGPAGTGKTYLAVAVGVSMYLKGEVDKIILSRPAVEAGERLGFLPGDMKDKVDPYMQPLYDALNDFLEPKRLEKLLESKDIEIAPLAFMRGRTLSRAFIVLDEAQNTTKMQMKMFLTRIGQGSRMAITGDCTQIDLPKGVQSGLLEAQQVLKPIDDIGFVTFNSDDVVRHPMVSKIINAYARADAKASDEN